MKPFDAVLLLALLAAGLTMAFVVMRVPENEARAHVGLWRGEGEGWAVELDLRLDGRFRCIRRFSRSVPDEPMMSGRWTVDGERLVLTVEDHQAPSDDPPPYDIRARVFISEADESVEAWVIELEASRGPPPRRMRLERYVARD